MTTPTREEAIAFARQSLEAGTRSPEVVERLVKLGYDEIPAFGIVHEAILAMAPPPSSFPTTRRIGLSDIRMGLLVLATGAVVTFLSAAVTDATGRHRYFIAGGAILWGGVYILRGIWRVVRG